MSQYFITRVANWIKECFGDEGFNSSWRNHRFIEEALELVQTTGMTREDAHRIVDYVFDRPAGDLRQEVGGVMVTLAGHAFVNQYDFTECGETELSRVWNKIDLIRSKQALKPQVPSYKPKDEWANNEKVS